LAHTIFTLEYTAARQRHGGRWTNSASTYNLVAKTIFGHTCPQTVFAAVLLIETVAKPDSCSPH